MRRLTRKLPSHRGVFSYSRIPMPGGSVVYRLFRRDQRGALHCEMRNFHPDCKRAFIAKKLNLARHKLRDQVDEIDLALMGVTE
jgi:hypothetical protein